MSGPLGRSFLPRNSALAFDSLNLSPKPFAQGLFHFGLAAGAIQFFHRLTFSRQRNKAAGNTFLALPLRNKLLQQAVLAGMRTPRVAKIRADRRILENRRGSPRSVWRTPVPSVLKKAQFKSKYVENVAIVLSHRSPLLRAGCHWPDEKAVYSVTRNSD